MGEWTWLFTKFPLAEVELTNDPIPPDVANVLVRTFRPWPSRDGFYEVRIAPHNVASFRAGPWRSVFPEAELVNPGAALQSWKLDVWRDIERVRGDNG
ncbi:hypothetical protein GCM10025857_33380 [Alicyclobacillus contaminans]|uniref:hypothetical protein n=1 Tax=Alicyclobacillus contaminans TaxID=392016 RepID=UPI00040E46C5|nr:hypothetical protein [Alicyclobacillus contaminans]GMA51981.1 hypothetical protein GCM10025857_33380 [Alicyclobacillus contaminans]